MADKDKLEHIERFITKVGFPIAIAFPFACLAVWLIYNQITTTDGLIRADTEAKIEMTAAINSLKDTSLQMGTSLKSMEMETARRLDRIEMKLEGK